MSAEQQFSSGGGSGYDAESPSAAAPATESSTVTASSSSSAKPLVIECENFSSGRRKRFTCPQAGCGQKFTSLVFLKVHHRKHREEAKGLYRCLWVAKDGQHCQHTTSVKGNMQTHVHVKHTRNKRKNFNRHYLAQFIEEDAELLRQEEALFAGAELKWKCTSSDNDVKKQEATKNKKRKNAPSLPAIKKEEEEKEDSIEASKEEMKMDISDDYDSIDAQLLDQCRQFELKYPFRCRMGDVQDERIKEGQLACEWRFSSAADRDVHEREHLGIEPFQCVWPEEEEKKGPDSGEGDTSANSFCGLRFLRRQFAREHIREVHCGGGLLDSTSAEDDAAALDLYISVDVDLLNA